MNEILPCHCVYCRPRANESVIELAEGDPSESSVIREWVAHRISQHNKLHGKFSEMILSQERALHELKLANRQLYDLAVQVSLPSACY